MAKVMTIAVSLTAFISKATQIVCLFFSHTFWYIVFLQCKKNSNFAFNGGSKQKTTKDGGFVGLSFFFYFFFVNLSG